MKYETLNENSLNLKNIAGRDIIKVIYLKNILKAKCYDSNNNII